MFRLLPIFGSGRFFYAFFAQFVQYVCYNSFKKYSLYIMPFKNRPSYFVYIEQTTNNKQTKPQTSGKHLLVICNCKNDITQDTPILRCNDLK